MNGPDDASGPNTAEDRDGAARDDAARDDVAVALARFAQILRQEHDASDIMHTLSNECSRLLPVHGAGVLVSRDGPYDLLVAAANTDLGREVEELEARLEEGPCHDSLRLGQQVLVPDLTNAVDSYPRFAPLAMEAGIRSVQALPMASRRGGVVASLDLVAREPLTLERPQLATAQLLADVAFSFIVNLTLHRAKDDLAAQLQEALESRIVIEQAKGMLAERHAERPDEAFDRLRNYARSNGQRLREVAVDIVDRRLEL